MSIERRSSPRFTLKQFIDLSSDGEDFIQAKGMNLSAGGLSIETSSPLDPMAPIFVMLGVPEANGERILKVEGYVAHSHMDGGKCVAGICFTDIAPDDKEAIDAYIQSLARNDQKPN